MEARVKDHVQSLKEKEALADQKIIDTQEETERNKLSAFRATSTVKRLRKRIEKMKTK